MNGDCNSQTGNFAEVISITELLKKKLNIPNYQRPYKWGVQNIEELLKDINVAIEDYDKYGGRFKYRIGTIILHKKSDGNFDIIDGQQRIISLLLIYLCLKPEENFSISDHQFTNKITQANIHENYMFIARWLKGDKDNFIKAFDDILEVVVLNVKKESEAFQLFDSQNARGKALDPHDLLKAYHLREMKQYPYEMQHAVTRWEAREASQIRELFDLFLFPIWNWSRGMKSKPFTAKEIDTYKGISELLPYTYARRVRKAMPCFQITEPFISGNDFFEMVEHYLQLLTDIKTEIFTEKKFDEIKKIICKGRNVYSIEEMDSIKYGSAGFVYARNLFYCALLCYYDKFHNFDVMAVKNLFIWAFMLRVDLRSLGFASINKYAIGGENNSSYTNKIPMFSKISFARLHNEISSLSIKLPEEVSENWPDLYKDLSIMNGASNGGNI